jgi:hypothetical protein
MLPRYCQQCPAGKSGGCAKWVCKESKCSMSFCEKVHARSGVTRGAAG